MKDDIKQTNLVRERMLWLGALIITAVVFLVIGLSSPLSFTNVRNEDRQQITIEKATDATSSDISSINNTALYATSVTSATTTVTSDRININTATAEELMTVPGIGEAFAQRILAYRHAHNGFTSLAELKEVEGVGDSRYNSWSPYLTVN